MTFLNIKPMSINVAFQGKRFKTKAYKKYEKDVLLMLPSIKIPTSKNMIIHLEFGVSSELADWDNPIKPFVDILQKKYGFNDRYIYRGKVVKVKVSKGKEYIKWRLEDEQRPGK